MNRCERLYHFLEKASGDPRISAVHISLYVALLYWHQPVSPEAPLSVSKDAIMQVAHISARSTYQQCIHDLHDFAYIRYEPTYNHDLFSRVYFT